MENVFHLIVNVVMTGSVALTVGSLAMMAGEFLNVGGAR